MEETVSCDGMRFFLCVWGLANFASVMYIFYIVGLWCIHRWDLIHGRRGR